MEQLIKISRLVTALAGLFLLFYPISLKAAPQEHKLRLLITSDLHGWLSNRYLFPNRKPKGLIHIAEYIKRIRRRVPYSMLLDAGDIISGSPDSIYYNYIAPEKLVENHFFKLFNKLRYDVVIPGNHDLELYPLLLEYYLPRSSAKWIAANIITTPKNIFPAYQVIEQSDFKVVVIGITTPGILMWSDIKYKKNIKITSIETALKKWMPIIKKKEKPDFIILLIHEGLNPFRDDENSKLNRIPPASSIRLIMADFPGIELVISGHDHYLYPYKQGQPMKYIHNRPVISGGHHGEAVIDIELQLKKHAHRWHIAAHRYNLFRGNRSGLSNRPSFLFNKAYITNMETYLGWKITKVRKKIAINCLNQLLSTAFIQPDLTGTFFPLLNRLSIRDSIGKPLQRKHIYRWLPYPNRAVTLTVSRNDIYRLTHPEPEFGQFKIPSNRKLFARIVNREAYNFDKQRWFLHREDFKRKYQIKISDYHYYGGGGVISGLFIDRSARVEISDRIFQEQLVAYFKTHQVLKPKSCSFLKSYKVTSAESPK